MRQSGLLAAAASYALDHQVDRLAEDHALARRLAVTMHAMWRSGEPFRWTKQAEAAA